MIKLDDWFMIAMSVKFGLNNNILKGFSLVTSLKSVWCIELWEPHG